MSSGSAREALRRARAFAVERSDIEKCLHLGEEPDRLFAGVLSDGLDALPPPLRRGRLASVTGSVAEAVASMVLCARGYEVFFDVAGRGLHGVDLLLLAPDESVVALEVKGTLRQGLTARMTPSALRQMSRAWLNGQDNPGMLEWSLRADDLYAGVMVVDFAASTWRVALSGDFETFAPIESPADLDRPAMLCEWRSSQFSPPVDPGRRRSS